MLPNWSSTLLTYISKKLAKLTFLASQEHSSDKIELILCGIWDNKRVKNAMYPILLNNIIL